MPLPTPITLNLYDPNTSELVKTLIRPFVPWKMLKKAIRLNKHLNAKDVNNYDESDIDMLTQYIIDVFPEGLTIKMLDEQSDITEMVTVVRTVVNRAKGIMDPTLPPK